jgi:transposase-like protein
MATCTRGHHSPAFKVEAFLAIIRQDCTMAELAEQFAAPEGFFRHRTRIRLMTEWKAMFKPRAEL